MFKKLKVLFQNVIPAILVFVSLAQFNFILFLYVILQDYVIYYFIANPLILMIEHKDENIPVIHYSLTLFLSHILKKKLLYFIVYVIGMTIQSEHTAIYATIFGKILDMVQQGVGFNWENGWSQILLYTMAGVSLSICYALTSLLSSKLIPWVAAEVRGYYFKYILGHSYFYFSQTLSGDILTRINNITTGSIRVLHYFFDEGIPVLVFTATTIFVYMRPYPQFQYTLLAWMVVHFSISMYRLPKYIAVSMDNARQYAGLMGIIGNMLHNVFAIKFLYSNPFEQKYFDKYQNRDIDSFRNMKFYNTITEILMDSCSYMIFYSFIFIYQITKSYINGLITIGAALSVYNILRSLASQVWKATENVGDLMLEISRCKDAMNLMKIPNNVPDNHKEVDLQPGEGHLKGSLEIKEVYFYYSNQELSNTSQYKPQPESYLFEDLNLFVKPYSKVALVGSSGSGKSTLATLILRLMDPIKGSVFINGQDISKVSKSSLRNSISFIPQREFLFNRPLFENIGYGCPEIRDEFLLNNYNKDVTFQNLKPETQQRIVEIAQKSESHDFIINLPKGYDSVYGSDIRLSGGQCQRIMIARAFINDKAQFLLLDEATSALDPDTEKSIQRTIKTMSVGKTVLVIAHKLNTISDFDCIVVFERGKIIECGTHDELIKAKKKYYHMWSAGHS